MSYSNPFPPLPGHPLTYWLDSDMARTAPETSTSALRDMAWIHGQWRGLSGAVTGLGITLLGGGLLSLVTMTSAIALWLKFSRSVPGDWDYAALSFDAVRGYSNAARCGTSVEAFAGVACVTCRGASSTYGDFSYMHRRGVLQTSWPVFRTI